MQQTCLCKSPACFAALSTPACHAFRHAASRPACTTPDCVSVSHTSSLRGRTIPLKHVQQAARELAAGATRSKQWGGGEAAMERGRGSNGAGARQRARSATTTTSARGQRPERGPRIRVEATRPVPPAHAASPILCPCHDECLLAKPSASRRGKLSIRPLKLDTRNASGAKHRTAKQQEWRAVPHPITIHRRGALPLLALLKRARRRQSVREETGAMGYPDRPGP